jgi:hypothetical protein
MEQIEEEISMSKIANPRTENDDMQVDFSADTDPNVLFERIRELEAENDMLRAESKVEGKFSV